MTSLNKPFRFLFSLIFFVAAACFLFGQFNSVQADEAETYTVYLPVVINQSALEGTTSTSPVSPPAPPAPAPPTSTPPAFSEPTATIDLACDSETTLVLKVAGQHWETSMTSIYWNEVIQGQIMPSQEGEINASYRHYQPQNGLHTIRVDNGQEQVEIETEISCLNVVEPETPEPETPEPVLPDLVISQPEIVGELSSETAVTVAVTVTNSSDVSLYKMIFIDLFIDPTTVAEDHIPLVESDAFMMITSINANESRVLTFTLLEGVPQESSLIYAMVDTAQIIDEADEQNNVSTPLMLAR